MIHLCSWVDNFVVKFFFDLRQTNKPLLLFKYLGSLNPQEKKQVLEEEGSCSEYVLSHMECKPKMGLNCKAGSLEQLGIPQEVISLI